jgi:hypothetical protein
VAEETPYEFVRRRRLEGASTEALNAELVGRGLDGQEIALLLGQGVRAPVLEEEKSADGTAWALVKKLRAEGFPPDAIARELESRGHSAGDIKAILADESPREVQDSAPGSGIGIAPVQLIFGVLLILAGVLLILGGRISLLSIGLIAAGVARVGSSLATERGTIALQAEARRQMATLADDDPRARCAVHQAYASIGNCPRCGSFCCAMCTPAKGFGSGNLCMQCQALPDVRAERQQRASRQAALTLLTAPAMLVLFTGLELVLATRIPSALTVVAAVAISSAPWLVLAAVQAKVKSGWPVIISVVPWLTVEVFLTMGNASLQGGLWLLPLGAAFYGWMSTRQAAQLEEPLVAALSSPAP